MGAETNKLHSKSQSLAKPKKPYPDFPLFAHQTRRWAKKIKGRFHYFGPWRDPNAALEKYLAEKDYLHAGKKPPTLTEGLILKDLVNRFLTSKQQRIDTAELSERTFQSYLATCERVLVKFGKTRLVEDLNPEDFASLRTSLAKTRKAVSLGNEITRCKMIFKYGYDEGLIDRPIRYGQSFSKPSKKTIRIQRNQKGLQMFESEELLTVLENAPLQLKAMILLGVNCGFGQSDVAALPKNAINFNTGWCDFPRPKTGIERRCKLWRETVEALQDAIANRPAAKDELDDDLCFITRTGQRWVRLNKNGKGTPDDAVGKEISKLLKKLEIKRKGVNFYALRHTFQTIGGESRDQIAVNHIMGHVDNSMASHYRERISDERLQAVTDHVHSWLFNSNQDKTN